MQRKKLISILGHFTLLTMISLSFACAQTDNQKVAELQGEALELDFVIENGQFSFDGTRAVVWGQKIETIAGSKDGAGTEKIAVVDLANMKVISQQNYGARVRSAAINNDYVFVSPKTGNLVYRYDYDFRKNKRLFTTFPVDRMTALPNGKLGFPAKIFGGMLTVNIETMEFDLPKEAIDFPMSKTKRRASTSQQISSPLTFLTNNRIKVNEQVFDLENGEIFSVDAGELPAVLERNSAVTKLFANNQSKFFGRRMIQQKLLDHNRVVIANLYKAGSIHWPNLYSSEQPVFYALSHERNYQRSQNGLVLETRQLSDGKIVDERNLILGKGSSALPSQAQHLDDRLIMFVSNRIVSFQLPPIEDDKIGQVLHLSDLPTHIVGPKETKIVTIDCQGGKGDLNFQLLFEYPGISIDGETGQITIEGEQILNQFLNRTKGSSRIRINSARARFEAELAKVSPEIYRAALGRELPEGNIPMSLPICVGVSDETGNSDSLCAFAIVLIPKKKIDELIAEFRNPNENPAPAVANREVIKDQAKRDAARIEELEERIRGLEELLKSLDQKLDDANKPAAKK